jgi:hypothetical protein
MSEQELTLALRALGRRLDAEPVADVAPAVLVRIAGEVPARRRLRPVVLAFVALLLIAATAVAASDDLRRWLRGSGVDIQRVEILPPVVTVPETTATTSGTTTAPVAASFAGLGLGTRVDAAAAEKALGIPLPVSSELGPPAAIFSADTADGPAVTLAWTPADPVLLTVVPAHDENDPFLIGKALTSASSVDYLTLSDGREGIYISGAPHAVTMFDGRKVQFRLAQDVLLWRPTGPRVYRLEGTFDRARALALESSFDHAP